METVDSGGEAERCTCLQLWVPGGLPFQAPQERRLMNVLLNTLPGTVLNVSKELLSLRLLLASFQPSDLWDRPFFLS